MDTDYPGFDIKLLVTNSAKECQFECSKEKRCEGFTWSDITRSIGPNGHKVVKNTCYLRNAILSATEHKGFVSGPKYCGKLGTSCTYLLL